MYHWDAQFHRGQYQRKSVKKMSRQPTSTLRSLSNRLTVAWDLADEFVLKFIAYLLHAPPGHNTTSVLIKRTHMLSSGLSNLSIHPHLMTLCVKNKELLYISRLGAKVKGVFENVDFGNLYNKGNVILLRK